MAQRSDDGLVSVADYLAMEERSEVRHEYVGGMLYAMAGSTDRHNRIAFNIARALADVADGEGSPCRIYITDMRFLIGSVYYYPDVMVACEPPETDNPTWRTNPCLVVAVLSPSSELTDRREKLLAYRSVDTVQTYLIVHQDTQRVERHFRTGPDTWARADHVHDSDIPVPCLDARLTLAQIHRGLD